jgi:hypothetical protein
VSANQEIENTFNIVGVEFDWWFRDLNVFGLVAHQHDDDPRGTGETIDSDSWFVEGDYTVYPWLVGIVQYGARTQDFSIRTDPAMEKPGSRRGLVARANAVHVRGRPGRRPAGQ